MSYGSASGRSHRPEAREYSIAGTAMLRCAMDSPIKLIKTYASFVKFAHTVFALPFAVGGMVAAYAFPVGINVSPADVPPARDYPLFTWDTVGLILLCMVGARSFAMAANRIIDRRIDSLNPRTAKRELPSGTLKVWQACVFAVLSAALYFGACAMISEIVLWLIGRSCLCEPRHQVW